MNDEPAETTGAPATAARTSALATHRATTAGTATATPPPAATRPPVPASSANPAPAYRIEELAHRSGTTVRTIRAYQDKGLLPRPERRGRANVYADSHLHRLHQIADLLDRGYTLASIKELLDAWDTGRGLGGVLGLVAEVDGPWTDEEAVRITRSELIERFGGVPDEAAVTDAVALGVLEPVPGEEHLFLVPSPQELSVAVELHAAGVPLSAITGHLRELRGQIEHIAARFLDFTTEHVFARYLGGHQPPSEAETAEAAALVRRLRPLAQQSVDAELARAMRSLATRHLRQHLHADTPVQRTSESLPVLIPASTIQAVERLVGPEHLQAFITAATEREVQTRTLDDLTASARKVKELDQSP
ncbi:MerR family transcriptional regulator [Streptomyces heilongjiangensis]|uniref:MerR family transcriptional regulator n=1 Tax=Streptomyces heilongjiangensis TaxID=945052 RepID=A0ABW1BHS1_9ACTN|nr:MerR family transcriptional regulator [Streptomyces heilongjiangensis]MDC2950789.1 MerR family transcriptional regulator [Streptomyces heilongjiangensis]